MIADVYARRHLRPLPDEAGEVADLAARICRGRLDRGRSAGERSTRDTGHAVSTSEDHLSGPAMDEQLCAGLRRLRRAVVLEQENPV